jgi:hypothetical protein
MWLQLKCPSTSVDGLGVSKAAIRFAALAWIACASSTSRAQSLARVDNRAAMYQDTDRTTIVTNNIAARGAPSDHVGVDARYLIDVITSASVDVITAATSAFHEVRDEVEAGANYHNDDRKIAASYIYSTEHDWTSHTGNASYQQDIVAHDVTLKLAGTVTANDVGRAGDQNFHRRLTVGGGTAGLTFALGPSDLLDAGYTFSYLNGYQASPYRFVSFHGTSGSPLLLNEPEIDPNVRVRHALPSAGTTICSPIQRFARMRACTSMIGGSPRSRRAPSALWAGSPSRPRSSCAAMPKSMPSSIRRTIRSRCAT